jgi:hypothetical protein
MTSQTITADVMSMPASPLLARALASLKPVGKQLGAQSTWWDSLTVEEKRSCVEESGLERDIGGGTKAWHPDGELKRKWEDRPEGIHALVQQVASGKDSQIFKGCACKTTTGFHLWMVGRSPDAVSPTVAVINASIKIARKTIKVIKDSECIKRFGFGFLAYKASLFQAAGDLTDTPAVDERTIGTRIIIPACPSIFFSTPRKATLGGAFQIDQKWYALTVAHPFFGVSSDANGFLSSESNSGEEPKHEYYGPRDEIYTEDETEDELDAIESLVCAFDDIFTAKDVYLEPIYPHTLSKLEQPLTSATLFRKIGSIPTPLPPSFEALPEAEEPKWICRSLDYAIVELDNLEEIFPTPEEANFSQDSQFFIHAARRMPQSSSKVALFTAGKEMAQAIFSGSTCSIQFPGSKSFHEAWTLDHKCSKFLRHS